MLSDFEEHLTNTAWAFAVCQVTDAPLMYAISSSSIARIASASPQGLANLAWAVAKSMLQHMTLLAAISAAALAKMTEWHS